jgi:hypothetical protein
MELTLATGIIERALGLFRRRVISRLSGEA